MKSSIIFYNKWFPDDELQEHECHDLHLLNYSVSKKKFPDKYGMQEYKTETCPFFFNIR